jgi:endonuclease/exonuclease/phosphatase (EEP) superfamily protein YafD
MKHAKKIIQWLCYLLGFLVITGTLLPLLGSEQWYVRMFDFPRIQLLFLAGLSLLLYAFLIFRPKKGPLIFLFLLLCVIIFQSIRIFPYTPLASYQVLYSDRQPSGEAISLLVSNVFMENEEYGRLLHLIEQEQPHVVLTLETDSSWQEALHPLHERYPYRAEVPLSNTYGMLLHSRLPLKNTEVHYLIEEDIPSISTLVALPTGKWVQLYAVHPRPPVPTESEDSKERDAEIVLIGKKASASAYPAIVAGDFNDVAWSATTELFQEVSGLLDPRIGRGFYNTFHAKNVLMRWPLDHFFHSNHFKVVEIKRLGGIGSDHFPIFIRLELDPKASLQQEKPKPDKDTPEQARETIEEGRADQSKEQPGNPEP